MRGGGGRGEKDKGEIRKGRLRCRANGVKRGEQELDR